MQREHLHAPTMDFKILQGSAIHWPSLSGGDRQSAVFKQGAEILPFRDLGHQITADNEHQLNPRPEALGTFKGGDCPGAAQLLNNLQARVVDGLDQCSEEDAALL